MFTTCVEPDEAPKFAVEFDWEYEQRDDPLRLKHRALIIWKVSDVTRYVAALLQDVVPARCDVVPWNILEFGIVDLRLDAFTRPFVALRDEAPRVRVSRDVLEDVDAID
ncbi:MAG: hypothetical protein WCH74_06755 [Chloroflexota bacterium]